MTTYEVTWPGTGRAVVSDPAQIDKVLRALHDVGQPCVVDVFRYSGGRPDGGVQVGVGHPDRSFVLYFGEPAGGYAVEPGIEPWSCEIEFGYGGQPTSYHPAETRITPDVAFVLVRQLIATDNRPTGVTWDEDSDPSLDSADLGASDPPSIFWVDTHVGW
ncbi:Imm1 family immunity protein [Solwaraspora sp. WMMA2065]|uniref:Imm1 family immunity protein n=1 Tax=Solwaraspora sp. WMMA2065 TaxID=3015166 RepID=UPI00259B53FF|nr:Imm1 family immunity protein [Solwaraspora sp. WMMA2065]WJK33354.1 Imm1 family immunity protein [Solwaraspora sp. WMMA2065]